MNDVRFFRRNVSLGNHGKTVCSKMRSLFIDGVCLLLFLKNINVELNLEHGKRTEQKHDPFSSRKENYL